MKLRSKVFTAMVFAAVIPLIILTIFAYGRHRLTTYQRMDEISIALFDNAVEAANQSLDGFRQTSQLFTFYSEGSYSAVERLKQFTSKENYTNYDILRANQDLKFVCQNLFYSHSYIYGIYVFTPSGIVLGQSAGKNRDTRLGYDPVETQWYQDTLALDGGIYVSSLATHEDMFTGTATSLFFAQCLRDVYSHEFLGVLVVDCDLSLFDLSLVNTMPDIATLTLDNADTGSVLYTNAETPDSIPSKNSRQFHQNLAISPLRLTAAFDYAALYREFNVTSVLLILVACFCGIGILLLSYIISRNLVAPIEHLSRKMSAQQTPALSVSSRYLSRTDEIGTLYNEYNTMAEKINASIKRDYQDRLVLLDAQMKSLEARINSHFLFNTLESINSIAELADNEEIAVMSLALGNMFRYSIKTQSELVSISDELSHVKDYVSIQRIRFNNRFRLIIDIEESLTECRVLKLILQPLVENALFHGLNYCSCGDRITLSAQIRDALLYIQVADNGRGIPPGQLQKIQAQFREPATFTELGRRTDQSIGLKNIHSRIELYYGRGYGLTIKSREHEGTLIEIKLPLDKGESR